MSVSTETPGRYRKKPEFVEAIKWDGAIACWQAILEFGCQCYQMMPGELIVRTERGDVPLGVGGMVIKHDAGDDGSRFSAMTAEDFELAFDLADEPAEGESAERG